MRKLRQIVVGVLLAAVLSEPLGLIAVADAETVGMEYTDPDHLHAPKRVTVEGGTTADYQYDANGNLVSDGERTIEWNRLRQPLLLRRKQPNDFHRPFQTRR